MAADVRGDVSQRLNRAGRCARGSGLGSRCGARLSDSFTRQRSRRPLARTVGSEHPAHPRQNSRGNARCPEACLCTTRRKSKPCSAHGSNGLDADMARGSAGMMWLGRWWTPLVGLMRGARCKRWRPRYSRATKH
eukprot:9360559-Alexandrium_andersonii.AAC.1